MVKQGIVLNRMYVGDYLTSNLGHEVINLFKADNGCHYVYLNSTGNFAKEHSNKIGYMFFVKYYDKGLVEVIGMAAGLEEVPGADMQLNRELKFNGVDEDIWKLQREYIENSVAYFMERLDYYELWRDFFAIHGVEQKKGFAVKREVPAYIEDDEWDHKEKPSGGRVDLLIRDEENIVVIENKIKSDINTIAADGDDSTQLNRYMNYVDWLAQTKYDHKPNCYFAILTPAYNVPTISAPAYKIITYTNLYNF